MRKAMLAMIGAWAAVAVATLFARRATRHGDPAPMFEPRLAGETTLTRCAVPAGAYARIASLWPDRAGAHCRVRAVWAGETQATFASQMRVALPAGGVAALVAADAPANDADIAKRLAQVEPGVAPVVRILRAASFRPKRATFGDREVRTAKAA